MSRPQDDSSQRSATGPVTRASDEVAGQAAQGGQGVGASAGGSGREAEQPPVDSVTPPPPDDDRSVTPSEEGDGPSDTSKVEQDLDALLSDTKRERDEYLELAKRTKADFENYRKRMAADVQAATARGKGELARELIDAVDNLERALASAGVDPEQQEPLDGGEAQVEDAAGLAHGVLLVLRGMQETLRRNGIEPLDPRGERFDPNWHEALSSLPTAGAESGTVVEVMQKGYKLGEHLIRPARVVVAE
jgi:molecular chaperone GrpE